MTVVVVLLRTLSALVLAALAAPFVWEQASGDYFMTVTGESMEPTYSVGDVLVVQQPTGHELKVRGTIVVVSFTPGAKSEQYVHRVVEPTADGAILQGDNNATADPNPVTPVQVMGTPRTVLDGPVARAYHLTQTPIGRIVFAGLALIGLVVPVRRRAAAGRHRGGSESDPALDTGAGQATSSIR